MKLGLIEKVERPTSWVNRLLLEEKTQWRYKDLPIDETGK